MSRRYVITVELDPTINHDTLFKLVKAISYQALVVDDEAFVLGQFEDEPDWSPPTGMGYLIERGYEPPIDWSPPVGPRYQVPWDREEMLEEITARIEARAYRSSYHDEEE